MVLPNRIQRMEIEVWYLKLIFKLIIKKKSLTKTPVTKTKPCPSSRVIENDDHEDARMIKTGSLNSHTFDYWHPKIQRSKTKFYSEILEELWELIIYFAPNFLKLIYPKSKDDCNNYKF